MKEWISVKDRLPEKQSGYLCYCTTQSQYDEQRASASVVGYFENGEFRTHLNYMPALLKNIEVTHWMPLPEPPK